MSRELTPQETAERSLIKTYRKSIWNPFIAAVKRYELIEPGDRIAVCISGGKCTNANSNTIYCYN